MILITGSTGFIGQYVTRRLLAEGYSVRLLCRDTGMAGAMFPSAEAVKGDVLDVESLRAAMKGVTKVIHLAGVVSFSLPRYELFLINYGGTRNVLEASKNVDKLLFSSSVSVYGDTPSVADESFPTNPNTDYGLSKLEAEKAAFYSGIPTIAYRIGPVYGIGSPVWSEVLRFLEKKYPIPNVRTMTNLVHVSDVSRAFLLGLNKGKLTGIYNITGEKPLPFLDFARLLCYYLPVRPRVLPAPLVMLVARLLGKRRYFNALCMNRLYDCSKAKRELGFSEEADLDGETRKMVEWYKSHRAGVTKYAGDMA
ncbi:MAG: NAD-dependent epimerase/dehydratase family protein [Candidatus Aenigmarchaeota archaeon]|nr:NAD-dependent epimerase/dehydratase family protein [Candidatus Aenigmarchaeota archaeon]